jgi:hypothetical protein
LMKRDTRQYNMHYWYFWLKQESNLRLSAASYNFKTKSYETIFWFFS